MLTVRRLAVPALLAAAVAAGGPAVAASRPSTIAVTSNVTLRIPGVTKGCTGPAGQPDSVGVRSVSFGAVRGPVDPGAHGDVPLPTLEPLVVTKALDTCSAKLFLTAFQGTPLDEAVVTFFDAQGQAAFEIRFSEDVVIATFQVATATGGDGGAEVLEQVHLIGCKLAFGAAGVTPTPVDICQTGLAPAAGPRRR
jgi:hypothetical protein